MFVLCDFEMTIMFKTAFGSPLLSVICLVTNSHSVIFMKQ